MDYSTLKTRQRMESDKHPTNLALRVQRSLSWLNRAEQCQNEDSCFRNNLQFYENVIVPSFYRKEQLIMQALNLPKIAYDEGGDQAETPLESLRSIVVQPIPMGISLFLILMTILRTPQRLDKMNRGPGISIH